MDDTVEEELRGEDGENEESASSSAGQRTQLQEDEASSGMKTPSTTSAVHDPDQPLVDNSYTWISNRTMTPDMYFCRICHQRNLAERNLSPCHCRGSMALVHKSCLERWLAASDSTSCEICGYRFNVRRRPKYDIFTAVKVWLKAEDCIWDRLYLASDSLRVFTTMPFILLANHQTLVLLDLFQIDDIDIFDLFSFFGEVEIDMDELALTVGRLLTYVIVGAVSALDVLTIGWFYSRFESHFSQWQRWYRSQCYVSIQLTHNVENNK